MMGISGILHFKIDICIYWCVCVCVWLWYHLIYIIIS